MSMDRGKASKAMRVLPEYYLCPLMYLGKGWELAGGPQAECEVRRAYCWLWNEEGPHCLAGSGEGWPHDVTFTT